MVQQPVSSPGLINQPLTGITIPPPFLVLPQAVFPPGWLLYTCFGLLCLPAFHMPCPLETLQLYMVQEFRFLVQCVELYRTLQVRISYTTPSSEICPACCKTSPLRNNLWVCRTSQLDVHFTELKLSFMVDIMTLDNNHKEVEVCFLHPVFSGSFSPYHCY